MKPKRFKDVEEDKKKYITKRISNQDIFYKIFNDYVQINIKNIVNNILDDENMGKFKSDKIMLSIPTNDGNITGNAVNLHINNRRFTIRLKNMEVIPSKQQKIDYDNTQPHRWSISQWAKLIENLWYQYYGFQAMELNIRGNEGGVRRGKVFSRIKSIKNKIMSESGLKLSETDVVDYLQWAFKEKSKKVSLTLALLSCDNMVQEWAILKRKELKNINVNNTKKPRKWD